MELKTATKHGVKPKCGTPNKASGNYMYESVIYFTNSKNLFHRIFDRNTRTLQIGLEGEEKMESSAYHPIKYSEQQWKAAPSRQQANITVINLVIWPYLVVLI